VNEAALLAARHDRDHITTQLLDEARDKVLMGAPRAITQSEEARRLTAYHEGGHALVALYTPGAKPIHKATIVPRGQALGMVSQVPDKDEYSTTRQQLRAHIDVCMGGKAAEELVFGEDHVTSGATSDLRQATRIARHMVAECGMSDRIGPGEGRRRGEGAARGSPSRERALEGQPAGSVTSSRSADGQDLAEKEGRASAPGSAAPSACLLRSGSAPKRFPSAPTRAATLAAEARRCPSACVQWPWARSRAPPRGRRWMPRWRRC
jgi:hypothetical protein